MTVSYWEEAVIQKWFNLVWQTEFPQRPNEFVTQVDRVFAHLGTSLRSTSGLLEVSSVNWAAFS